VKEKGLPDVVVGVPLIVQVVPVPEVQPDKPPGREPLVLLQVTVPLKFEAVSVCEYTVPTVPEGKLVGEIEALSAPLGNTSQVGSTFQLITLAALVLSQFHAAAPLALDCVNDAAAKA
jgi:hypothetical protein